MKKSSFGENSVFSDVYSQAADFGKGYTYVVSAFLFVICIIAIIGGIALISRKAHNIKVDFVITNVTSRTTPEVIIQSTDGPKQTTVYDLVGTVSKCPGQTFTLVGYGNFVKVGQTIEAWVDPSCSKGEAFAASDETHTLGWGIIIVSIIGIILIMVRLFLVKRYKGYAALSGAAGAANMFKLFK
jgi:hypothetical protein